MSPLIVFLLFAIGLFVLSFGLRVHSSAIFIAITGGYITAQFISDDSGYINAVTDSGVQYAQLAAFLVPILLTLWLMRKSLPSSQFILQFLPHLGNSLLAFILILAFLPTGLLTTLQSDPIARTLINADDVIIMFAVVLQLFLMILTARPSHDHKKK